MYAVWVPNLIASVFNLSLALPLGYMQPCHNNSPQAEWRCPLIALKTHLPLIPQRRQQVNEEQKFQQKTGHKTTSAFFRATAWILTPSTFNNKTSRSISLLRKERKQPNTYCNLLRNRELRSLLKSQTITHCGGLQCSGSLKWRHFGFSPRRKAKCGAK